MNCKSVENLKVFCRSIIEVFCNRNLKRTAFEWNLVNEKSENSRTFAHQELNHSNLKIIVVFKSSAKLRVVVVGLSFFGGKAFYVCVNLMNRLNRICL